MRTTLRVWLFILEVFCITPTLLVGDHSSLRLNFFSWRRLGVRCGWMFKIIHGSGCSVGAWCFRKRLLSKPQCIRLSSNSARSAVRASILPAFLMRQEKSCFDSNDHSKLHNWTKLNLMVISIEIVAILTTCLVIVSTFAVLKFIYLFKHVLRKYSFVLIFTDNNVMTTVTVKV